MIDHERLDFLQKCCVLDESEWGEGVFSLIEAYKSCQSVSSTEFISALETELLGQLEWAEQHCRIVTRTETREITFEELEVDND